MDSSGWSLTCYWGKIWDTHKSHTKVTFRPWHGSAGNERILITDNDYREGAQMLIPLLASYALNLIRGEYDKAVISGTLGSEWVVVGGLRPLYQYWHLHRARVCGNKKKRPTFSFAYILYYSTTTIQWNPDICITLVVPANLMQKSVWTLVYLGR